jgi:glucokinase
VKKLIGVDIGGTKIKSAVLDVQGEIFDSITEATPQTPEGITQMIVDHYLALEGRIGNESTIEGLGIATAGGVGSDSNTVLFGSNIAWNNYRLGDSVARLLGDKVRVVVENDANAAAWAEFKLGEFRSVNPFLAVTIGTGLGGAIIINGELVRGYNGMAAEFGHYQFIPSGVVCGCGLIGCFEQYASGTALTRYVKERAAAELESAQLIIETAPGINQITGPMVTELAGQDDPFSVAVLTQLGHWIGQGMAALAALFDPEVFVIGGGLVSAESHLLEPIKEALKSHLVAASIRKLPQIGFATFGNDAGAIGAGLLAL